MQRAPLAFCAALALTFLSGVAENGKARFRDEYPHAIFSSGALKAAIYLPDAKKGYYRGPRFEWAGMVAQVWMDGHTFFGELREPHDPKGQDHVCGTASEFGLELPPPGYEDAKPGATFLKIGVGWLRKPKKDEKYDFHTPYEVVTPLPWTVERLENGVRFCQQLKGGPSWGYDYQKEVKLDGGAGTLTIRQSLKNTGSRPLNSDHYNHNFLAFDGRPIGRDYRLDFAFTPAGQQYKPGQARYTGQALEFLHDKLPEEYFWVDLSGFKPDEALHAEVVASHAPSGLEVGYKRSLPLRIFKDDEKPALSLPIEHLRVYAEKPALSPEIFMPVAIDPGEELVWTDLWLFSAPPAATAPEPAAP